MDIFALLASVLLLKKDCYRKSSHYDMYILTTYIQSYLIARLYGDNPYNYLESYTTSFDPVWNIFIICTYSLQYLRNIIFIL
ncbi:hypothetical protein SAMN05444362_102221 [Dysgonomonas macrotermitis]|uniref:Uncharacterized protein n=1 Tax=Dysgonomonas macrotermitis TaxID=1346286 RepID=A0A1M4WGG9_9BACT|nr:hypothetical protein SAMN05444362_102221 [Dysgonomonas macrotermitis]